MLVLTRYTYDCCISVCVLSICSCAFVFQSAWVVQLINFIAQIFSMTAVFFWLNGSRPNSEALVASRKFPNALLTLFINLI